MGLATIGALAIACSSTPVTAPTELPAHLADHPSFLGVMFPASVGHGGAKLLCPENTWVCYQMALDAGANALEADLQVLGDGSLVMFHDDNAEEQTGANLELEMATLDQLRVLDMGYAFTPDDGLTFPYRDMGISVMTLPEFLEAFPGIPVLLDVKPESEAMFDALMSFAANDLSDDDRVRLYIKSNDDQERQGGTLPNQLRSLDPPPRVALSANERTQLVVALLTGETPPFDDFGPSWVDLNPNDVPNFDTVIESVGRWTRAEGHILTASTINELEDMESLIEAGDVDGLVTDRPDLQATLRQ